MPASAPLFPALLPASLPASTQLARYRGSRPVSASLSKSMWVGNASKKKRQLTRGCCVFGGFSARFWLGLCRRRLVAALVLLLLGCGRSYLPVLGSVRRGLCFFRWVSVALFGGVPRCAVLRSNGWVSAPHGRRCVSVGLAWIVFSVASFGSVLPVLVVSAWRRSVKQAKAFLGGLRFSTRCCRLWFSNRQVKFLFFCPSWRVPCARFLPVFP